MKGTSVRKNNHENKNEKEVAASAFGSIFAATLVGLTEVKGTSVVKASMSKFDAKKDAPGVCAEGGLPWLQEDYKSKEPPRFANFEFLEIRAIFKQIF